jgi:hypothetical protein
VAGRSRQPASLRCARQPMNWNLENSNSENSELYDSGLSPLRRFRLVWSRVGPNWRHWREYLRLPPR